jgi:multidrug efflux system membrane fusion protein
MTGSALAKPALWALAVLCAMVGAPLGGTLLARQNELADAAGKSALIATPLGKPVTAEIDFVGVLLPSQMANLTPRTDGKIVSVLRKVGQAVVKDDVIVGFDLRERKHELAVESAQLKAARADAASAAADLAFASKRAARRSTTVDIGGEHIALVSGEEAAQARSEAQSARARSASAAAHITEHEARVEQLMLAVEESEIRAPFDGVVSSVNFEAGMTAHPGDVVARVVGGRGLRVRIAVPEEWASLLAARHARLALEGQVLVADIDQVSPEPEPASRSFVIEGTVRASETSTQGDLQALVGRAVRASLVP